MLKAQRFSAPDRWRTGLRWVAAALFVGAGVKHLTNPTFFRQIVPPGLPSPRLLVAVSGVCEIVGGLGLLIRPLRRAAGWGLIALLIAVFPANIYMALAPQRFNNLQALQGFSRVHVSPHLLLWLRLPLQPVIIAWVWFVAISRRSHRDSKGEVGV